MHAWQWLIQQTINILVYRQEDTHTAYSPEGFCHRTHCICPRLISALCRLEFSALLPHLKHQLTIILRLVLLEWWNSSKSYLLSRLAKNSGFLLCQHFHQFCKWKQVLNGNFSDSHVNQGFFHCDQGIFHHRNYWRSCDARMQAAWWCNVLLLP